MKKLIHTFCFLFFANVLLGQIGLQLEEPTFVNKEGTDFTKSNISNPTFFTKKIKSTAPSDLKKYLLSDHVAQNVNNIFSKKNKTELAFFCKIEAEIEQSSKVPVRFRLGEVQAVDKKEGKWKQFNQ